MIVIFVNGEINWLNSFFSLKKDFAFVKIQEPVVLLV